MDLSGEGEVTFSVKEVRAFPALLLAFSSTISLPLRFFLVAGFCFVLVFLRRVASQGWSKQSGPSFYTSFCADISGRLPTCPVSMAIPQSTQ